MRRWIVHYADGKRSRPQPKGYAHVLMDVYRATYMEKISGWWRRRIYRNTSKDGRCVDDD